MSDLEPDRALAAIAAVTSLADMLNHVDLSIAGHSGLPMMTFKRDGGGTWSFGQGRTVPEPGSRWAVNPLSFKRGFICFDPTNKPAGEHMLPVNLPMPDPAELPATGFDWQSQWAANLKCTSGTDAGAEVVFKTTTVGGTQAIAGLIDSVRDRINSGQHGGKVAPIVLLEKGSYQKAEHGKIYFPILTVVDWMPLDAASAPPPSTPPASSTPEDEQPRRRRAG
jgi:hypothetical protein